jgi:ParB family chromosome partitioning protein
MIYRQAVKYDFSVRKTEEIVRKLNAEDEEFKPSKKKLPFPNEYMELKNHLNKYFNTSIGFKINEFCKGKIEIPFNNSTELERIIGIFDKLNS